MVVYVRTTRDWNEVMTQRYNGCLFGKTVFLNTPQCTKTDDRSGIPIVELDDMLLFIGESEFDFPAKVLNPANPPSRSGWFAFNIVASELKMITCTLKEACGNDACDGSHSDENCFSTESSTKKPKRSLDLKFVVKYEHGPDGNKIQCSLPMEIMSHSLAKIFVDESILTVDKNRLTASMLLTGIKQAVKRGLEFYTTQQTVQWKVLGWVWLQVGTDDKSYMCKKSHCTRLELLNPTNVEFREKLMPARG